MKIVKKRLDNLLLELKLAENIGKSCSLILRGSVYVNGNKVDKCGTLVKVNDKISVKQKEHDFASRGGIKLNHALSFFNIDVGGKTCMDIGAAHGGFTDCLLSYGASKIYAIDVGYGQMDLKIRNDRRVVIIDRQNIRTLGFNKIGTRIDIIVCDLSFISLKKISKKIGEFLKENGILILLIKPQFEVKKEDVESGGVIRTSEKIKKIVKDIIDFYESEGFIFIDKVKSPITGSRGNEEWFAYFKFKKDAQNI